MKSTKRNPKQETAIIEDIDGYEQLLTIFGLDKEGVK